jgi:hypothetical protein
MVSFSADNEIMNEVPTSGGVQGGRSSQFQTFFYFIPGASMNVLSPSLNGLPSGAGAARNTSTRSPVLLVPLWELLTE